MAAKSERYLAADVHGMGAGASDKNVPEWKKQTVGVNVSYGRVVNKTIKEQRESLPIFKLRCVRRMRACKCQRWLGGGFISAPLRPLLSNTDVFPFKFFS